MHANCNSLAGSIVARLNIPVFAARRAERVAGEYRWKLVYTGVAGRRAIPPGAARYATAYRG